MKVVETRNVSSGSHPPSSLSLKSMTNLMRKKVVIQKWMVRELEQ